MNGVSYDTPSLSGHNVHKVRSFKKALQPHLAKVELERRHFCDGEIKGGANVFCFVGG